MDSLIYSAFFEVFFHFDTVTTSLTVVIGIGSIVDILFGGLTRLWLKIVGFLSESYAEHISYEEYSQGAY